MSNVTARRRVMGLYKVKLSNKLSIFTAYIIMQKYYWRGH